MPYKYGVDPDVSWLLVDPATLGGRPEPLRDENLDRNPEDLFFSTSSVLARSDALEVSS